MSVDPITVAIAGLFTASGETLQFWSTFLNCTPELIAQWCGEGEAVCPTDAQMTRLISELEYTKDSKGCPEMPAALDYFWATLAAWENDPGQSSILLPLRDGETTALRVMRFTRDQWIENITRNMHLIPPRRRRDFADALLVTFNQFTDD